jgi:hypothetical protein
VSVSCVLGIEGTAKSLVSAQVSSKRSELQRVARRRGSTRVLCGAQPVAHRYRHLSLRADAQQKVQRILGILITRQTLRFTNQAPPLR